MFQYFRWFFVNNTNSSSMLDPVLTSSTLTAVVTPPAFWKAQGKLSSPAPRADFSMMNTAPNEPSRGGSAWDADRASRLMLSRASSSMLQNQHTDSQKHQKLFLCTQKLAVHVFDSLCISRSSLNPVSCKLCQYIDPHTRTHTTNMV